MSAPSSGRHLIRNALVADPANEACERRDILVQHGRIAAVEPAGAISPDAASDLAVYDATQRMVIPGLVNAHTHGHANLVKGVADRWTLELSLTHGPWLGGDRDPATMYLSAALGAADMVLKGCTACYDLVYEFPQPTPQGILAVAKAYADVGMRAVLAPMIADKTLFEAIPGLVDGLPAHLRQQVERFRLASPQQTLAAVERVIAIRGDLPDGISLALAPTIPHHCSDAFLARCKALAAEHDLRLHMHVAESRLQAVVGEEAYGCSLVRHLADRGLLGPKFTAAHAVWLDESDLDLLAESGAGIAHIPASNFRLGSGLALVRPMLERGIPVGLGTDGANSSDAMNMFEAVRLASFTSRAHDVARDAWLSAREALRLATEGSAAVLGMTGRIGRIAPGFAADLVCLDLAHINYLPLNDPTNQIVCCENADAVVDVMINGRFVVADRRLATIDLSKHVAGLADVVADMRARTGAARALANELEPFVADRARRLADRALSIDRHVRTPRVQDTEHLDP
jgi:5-methylthioadenosine/S-adenosylhomocysteine deaminase